MNYEKHLDSETCSKIIGPLVFEESSYNHLQYNAETKCLLCEDSFNLNMSLPVCLTHLFDVHNVVIEDVQNINKLHEYMTYWRNKFKCTPLEQLIPAVTIDSTGVRYFLMSVLLKEDKALRHKLRLDHALAVQEFERKDEHYIRPCLLCKVVFEGTRPKYFEHLSTQHNLQLGNPQNMVYLEELVNRIDEKLTALQCIFCEKTFPDRNILKEHMRKKLHKRINPKNREYDKFYIVNYLEEDKDWQVIQKEDDRYAIPRGNESNTDEEYSDWNEDADQIICLFCKHKDVNINTLCLHMDADHDFDFIQQSEHLDFYQKVKLINYIRKQVYDLKCIFCDELFQSSSQLTNHLVDNNHYKIPDVKIFDQPEFYFPTYENDSLLYLIDDVED
ncbi:unnamed protein product [Phaedon cochleariae]|uniref:C2H2-type domain-containing protein n=1 Tax=Phaedon cochleariae TaxID=80249 RepID=A0A9P0GNW8_PHACE|nr:unnamed protein product [Phaedon cochleariae]